jgi:hypothetical protein
MSPAPRRKGGLQVDPAVADFGRPAVQNRAAASSRQRAEAERERLKIDLPASVKETLAAKAKSLDTSQSQLAGWLIAYALDRAGADPELAAMLEGARVSARSLNFRWNLEIPEEWQK